MIYILLIKYAIQIAEVGVIIRSLLMERTEETHGNVS